MDSSGGFYEVEKDGELIQLNYHHPKFRPIPKIQSSTSSGEEVSHDDDHPLQPLVSYPYPRLGKKSDILETYPFSSCPETIGYSTLDDGFRTVQLTWRKKTNKHRSGVESDIFDCPKIIKHPYHPQHSLQLQYNDSKHPNHKSLCCGGEAIKEVYWCTICQVYIHPSCSIMPIPFVQDKQKRHHHPLTFFPRQVSLTCNVCGLLRKHCSTYVCLRCNFVAHKDCMSSPHLIKISRHHHRISYISSLSSGKWSCGVCRQSVNAEYGAYTCAKCEDYVVHTRCALRKDVWDGEELIDVLKEYDMAQDAGPFDIVSEGVIRHFRHDHLLRLDVIILYDENKICEACLLPIYDGNFYSCMKCEFILHETCAQACRRIQHALHPHPLRLRIKCKYLSGNYTCDACDRCCGGFVYECEVFGCSFDLDVRCASISEPFDYKGHEHPLFLALHPDEKPICEVCKLESENKLNCIECDFIICFKCATLPYKARYKHDTHFLTLSYGKDVCDKDWCETCERNLGDTNTKSFYWCDVCCTTLHINCLVGQYPNLKHGQVFEVPVSGSGDDYQVIVQNSMSQVFCDSCKNRCGKKIFKGDGFITCSTYCAYVIYSYLFQRFFY